MHVLLWISNFDMKNGILKEGTLGNNLEFTNWKIRTQQTDDIYQAEFNDGTRDSQFMIDGEIIHTWNSDCKTSFVIIVKDQKIVLMSTFRLDEYSLPNETDNVDAFTSTVVYYSHNSSFPYYSLFNSSSNNTNITDMFAYKLKHPAVGAVLAMFSLVTILGNLLVITSVYKELYLRTITNYFIVSLAVADLMVGGIVMPFSISLEMTNQVWLFGTEWCDMWHSFDVLASTASILNLCIISLDRYWAISDPIAYPTKMSSCKVMLLIAFVWLCSAGISFPAIAWWKAVTPSDLPSHMCFFTEDSAYLIFSSFVSFYCPTFVMMFVYWRIYLAAASQMRSLKMGSKVLTSNGSHGNREVMTLRIHRGGMPRQASDEYSNTYEKCISDPESQSLSPDSARTSIQSPGRQAKNITRKLRQFALSKKLTKIAREQKAAKTLGIVVGVFIICWMPFFVFNVLFGICHSACVSYPEIVFPVFTWLGYINSGMNPVIYALSMKDFRRAFGKIIFACCPKQHFEYRKTNNNCSSTSSFTVTCADRL